MRLYIVIVIVAFLIIPANARTGSGLTDNQAAHLCAGAYIDEALTSRGWEWWQTGLTVIGLSLAKESIDGSGFNSEDVVFSISGWGLNYLAKWIWPPQKLVFKPL